MLGNCNNKNCSFCDAMNSTKPPENAVPVPVDTLDARSLFPSELVERIDVIVDVANEVDSLSGDLIDRALEIDRAATIAGLINLASDMAVSCGYTPDQFQNIIQAATAISNAANYFGSLDVNRERMNQLNGMVKDCVARLPTK